MLRFSNEQRFVTFDHKRKGEAHIDGDLYLFTVNDMGEYSSFVGRTTKQVDYTAPGMPTLWVHDRFNRRVGRITYLYTVIENGEESLHAEVKFTDGTLWMVD